MDAKRCIKVSKFLSRYLRHAPQDLGLTLATGGWVAVDALLAACARRSFPITREELNEVVATNEKQRFAFSEDGKRIRANQGHSVEVDLALEVREPPTVLYHGTGAKSVEIIVVEGLKKMCRHHVHLSADTDTAQKVGARHGKPVIFAVDAEAMRAAGVVFYCSANGVWLTEVVAPKYLRLLEG